MAEINPRDIDATCIPASIRATYTDETAALADSPIAGDIVVIGGDVYTYTGSQFVPYGFQMDTEIPSSAFADPDNPTQAEAATWINSNHDTAPSGSRFYYPGTGSSLEPDYVYETDRSGVVTEIESPGASPLPVAIIELIGLESDTPQFHAGSSYTKPASCDVVSYNWELVDVSDGSTIASFGGAGGADASGETYVSDGTYDQFTMSVVDGFCGQMNVVLSVTDCNGLVSDTTTFQLSDYGFASMTFYSNGSTLNGTVSVSGGDAPVWDFGDGLTEEAETVSHVYTSGSVPYEVTVTGCKSAITEIVLSNTGVSGSIDDLFDGDPEGFTSLEVLNLDGSGFGGIVPDHTAWSGLTEFNLAGNAVSGFIGGDLQSTITVFDLSGNTVSGTVPDPTAATGLTVYNLSGNSVFGNIADFSGLTNLIVYDVSDTVVEGTLPSSISGLTNLETFSGRNSLVSGSLPTMTGLSSLQTIDWGEADLSGSIPNLTSLSSLVVLDLGGNAFSGNAPSVSGSPNLTQYSIDSNVLDYPASTFAGNNALVLVEVQNNAFDSAESVTAVCAVDALGTFSGTYNGSGTNANPTAVGDTCAASLAGRLWTVIT